MEKRQSQLKDVLAVLRRDGKVSRNWCLDRAPKDGGAITRLSDIIFRLRNSGYVIDGEKVPTLTSHDYIYTLKSSPKNADKKQIGA